MNDFLISLAEDQPVLWTLLVLGVVGGGALVLFFTWERLIKLGAAIYASLSRRRSR